MANLSSEINISSKSIIKIVLWSIFFYGLYYFRELLLILFLSIIIASVVDRLVSLFARFKIPRVATVSFVYILLLLSFILGFYFFIPIISEYINVFIQKLPSLLESLRIFGKDVIHLKEFSTYISQIAKDLDTGKIFEMIKTAIFGGANGFLSGAGNIVNGGINFVLTIVLSFYLSIEERSVQKFLRLISPKAYEDYIISLWDRSQQKISAWFIGQVSIALLISILVYIILTILNIPFAFTVAVIAFFGEMIPVVGLSISSLIAVFLAWSTGGATLLLTTAIVFLVLAQFESHFLYPKVMGRAVGMPTVIVILALVIGGTIAGFWGILIAVPASSFFVEMLADFEKKKKREWEDLY